jgi:hypothetical protein
VRVEWATLCRNATFSEGASAADIEGANLTTILVEDLPTDVIVTIAALLAAEPDEVGTKFDLILELTNPQGQLALDRTYPYIFDEPEVGHPPGWPVKEFILEFAEFEADTPGNHLVEIRVPNQLKPTSMFFWVELTREAQLRLTGEDDW